MSDPPPILRVRTTPASAVADALHHAGGPDLSDLTHVRSAHNASVFSAHAGDRAVFVKWYHSDHHAKSIDRMQDDTAEVRPRMSDDIGGVPDIIWAKRDAGLVVMSAVPGTPVIDALGAGQAAALMPAVARWLRAFGGSSLTEDRYATGHWLRKRTAQDKSGLSPDTVGLIDAALALQTRRWKDLGAVPVWKCRVPRDFGPHNFHHDRDGDQRRIWGFDLEGHRRQPLFQGLVNFAVSSERRLPAGPPGRYGLQNAVLGPFMEAFADMAPAPNVTAFMVCDCLIERVMKHDSGANGPGFRASLAAHLADS